MEAKPVQKLCRPLLLLFSGHRELETGLLVPSITKKITFKGNVNKSAVHSWGLRTLNIHDKFTRLISVHFLTEIVF